MIWTIQIKGSCQVRVFEPAQVIEWQLMGRRNSMDVGPGLQASYPYYKEVCVNTDHINQSSRSRKIVRESRINEIKHVQNEKPLREFTHKYHRKKKDFRPDR